MIDRGLINPSSDSKNIDKSKLCLKLTHSANKVVDFLESKLQQDGSYGADAKDLACYFKSPMMFIAANKQKLASLVLTHIKKQFMQEDGDFRTQDNLKSINPAYIEYWPYTNGWIVRAAHLLEIKEIVQPGYQYLEQYNLGTAGFLTNQEAKMTDVLSIAHYGLINLEMDKLDIAINAGNYLCEAIRKQPELDSGFYLRFDKNKNIIIDFPKDKTVFYYVSTKKPNQLHFMLGYPAAYLALLYKKTNNSEFLNAAKSYLNFSLSCDKSVYSCDFSHKIAWAASILYDCTGDEKFLAVIDKITDYFIANQKNGMWFTDDINASYDQSAEIACWFLDIVKNINSFKKKMEWAMTKDIEPIHSNSFAKSAIKYGIVALVAGVGLYSYCKWSNQRLRRVKQSLIILNHQMA
jgi:hypothetical protein